NESKKKNRKSRGVDIYLKRLYSILEILEITIGSSRIQSNERERRKDEKGKGRPSHRIIKPQHHRTTEPQNHYHRQPKYHQLQHQPKEQRNIN
ncbi:hypothetical protein CPB84DRAFT_1766795, partial [Gymnopilus junonius]